MFDADATPDKRLIGWDIAVTPGGATRADEPLATFLTGRWLLFTRYGARVAAIPAEHGAWPLREARLERSDQDLLRVAGLRDPKDEPVVHFSTGVRARLGFPAQTARLTAADDARSSRPRLRHRRV